MHSEAVRTARRGAFPQAATSPRGGAPRAWRLLLCLVLLAPVPAFAQATEPAPQTTPTPEELREIEEALKADAAAQAQAQPPLLSPPPAAPTPTQSGQSLQSLNPDISIIADVAAAWFSVDEPLQTGGHDPTKTGFQLQQLELAFGRTVDPYFRLDGNIVFSQFGVEIEEAYATTLSLPYGLQARVGQFLTRFGRFNPTHLHTWEFLDQPFVIGRYFGSEGNRGLGAELSWLVPLDWYMEVIVSATDPQGQATARSFLGSTSLPLSSPLDAQATGAVKQFFELSDDLSLMVGVSAATGPNGTGFRNRTDIYGADLYFKYRPLRGGDFTQVSLHAEGFYRRRQVPGDLLQDAGALAFVSWRFHPLWTTALRYEYGSPSWNLAGKVSDPFLDPEWKANRHRVSANLTLFPTEFSRLRLQGSVDAAGWLPQPTWALMLACEFSIGPHGAHKF